MESLSRVRIERIEVARLEGERPRAAGSNARLGDHGRTVRPQVARVLASDGSSGFGLTRIDEETARDLVGATLAFAFDPLLSAATGSGGDGRRLSLEYALWDLIARRRGQPVYLTACEVLGLPAPRTPPSIPCYDTTLYFDDLDLESDAAGAELIAAEARAGYERGHRAFKIKVGRGARHMEPERGTSRDVAVVRAVREAVGPGPEIMIDANNGYTLNLTRRVLDQLADCRLHWIEEPFHEDPVLYADLREWLERRSLRILLADGEGYASPALEECAERGLIDVLQRDIVSPGFSRWLHLGRHTPAIPAPHHYGTGLGNMVSGHLAGAVPRLAFLEWDEAAFAAVDASAYRVEEGRVTLPHGPGFGLGLDAERFARSVRESGFSVSA
ncbi:MAG TPA: enolase C-terminal domain-like protein [Candidatus Dormibacteraeota bacterium]|jgi:L-alanine-DL-glutamate epimerase-like enolase superfamily enzyme|nr:enolase C-terminal domain-like protein [Candidatus Dormibacteraeota bacterium]